MTPFSHSNKDALDDPYDVRQYGTDTSGRKILMNARMALALEVVCRQLDFTPTIVQGAYMARLGGGAADSAGYHDAGGCLDFRTWDMPVGGIDKFVHAMRAVGWAAWRRDAAHGGFDPHVHAVLMGDRDAAYGAIDQMHQYEAGLDGLSSRGADYEWRPKPLVTDFDYHAQVREDMALVDQIKAVVTTDGDRTRKVFSAFRQNSAERDKALQADIDAIKAELAELPRDKQDRILARLAQIREALSPEETP